MGHHHGIGEKMESLFKCFVVIHYFQLPWTGTFSGDFTTNLAPQCNAFSRALKFETLKSRIPRSRGMTGLQYPTLSKSATYHNHLLTFSLMVKTFQQYQAFVQSINSNVVGEAVYKIPAPIAANLVMPHPISL